MGVFCLPNLSRRCPVTVVAKPDAPRVRRGEGPDRQAFHGQQVLQKGIDRIAGNPSRSSERAAPGPEVDARHLQTGLRGEEEALFHLRKRGYVVVARRWQTPRLPGDVDLIAWEGETLCFIEVKTRTGRNIVPAEFAVDAGKQDRLRALASVFCKRFPEETRRRVPVRFDVVSVYLPASAAPGAHSGAVEIDLFPGAFSR
jgi:putative endonuclease